MKLCIQPPSRRAPPAKHAGPKAQASSQRRCRPRLALSSFAELPSRSDLVVDSGSTPQLEVHQCPELFLAIPHAVEVLTHKPFHSVRIEISSRPCLRRQHQVSHHGLKRLPEPCTDRDREADLSTPKRFRWQIGPERLLEEKLWPKAAAADSARDSRSNLYQFVL